MDQMVVESNIKQVNANVPPAPAQLLLRTSLLKQKSSQTTTVHITVETLPKWVFRKIALFVMSFKC
jgi:hypothetical protein